MTNMLDDLKAYFENTSEEQIKKDWAKSEKYDQVGITVDEFMKIQHTRGGKTISQIKEICKQLELEKDVLVVGLNTAELYLRMISEQGVEAEATKTDNGFIFKLKK